MPSSPAAAGAPEDVAQAPAVESEGSDRFRPGSPAAAFTHPAFRLLWSGSFASNIGTWMQNFTLAALALELAGASWFIGVILFAQLGPILFISPLGGVLADTFDRKRLLVTTQAIQAVFSLVLALLVLSGEPSKWAVVGIVLVIGIAGACTAPAMHATIPALVGKRDLPGAVSLNSTQMNASRVVGPLLAGVVIGLEHASTIFLINAATYAFVILAIVVAKFDSAPKGEHEPPLTRLRNGIIAARADPVIGRVLITVSIYSLFSLIFIYQMAPFAEDLLGDIGTFPILFSSFGLGAAVGAICVGTVLSRVSRPLMTRIGLVGFGLALAVFAITREPTAAYIAVFVTGWFYFVVITVLSTILQERVDDRVRGRVMALWMVGWAGFVPLGGLIAGPIIDVVGLTPVFIFGAIVSIALAGYADLRVPDDDGPIVPPDVPVISDDLD